MSIKGSTIRKIHSRTNHLIEALKCSLHYPPVHTEMEIEAICAGKAAMEEATEG